MARRTTSKPTNRLTIDQLLEKRWSSQSEAEDWLKKNKYDPANLGCIIGMADDRGIGLQISDVLTRPVFNGSSATSYLERSYSEVLRRDLITNSSGDCYLRIPGPFSSITMQYTAKFHSEVLHIAIEVVNQSGDVLYRFVPKNSKGQSPPQVNAPPVAPAKPPRQARKTLSAPEIARPADGAAASAKPARQARKTIPTAPESARPGRGSSRTVSNDEMHRLAIRATGVSNDELTTINGNNQPWKSWLTRIAAKTKMTLITERTNDRGVVHRLIN
jgi:hypothetical protein